MGDFQIWGLEKSIFSLLGAVAINNSLIGNVTSTLYCSYQQFHLIKVPAACRGNVAALARSHMSGSLPLKSTIEQTTETMHCMIFQMWSHTSYGWMIAIFKIKFTV